MIRIYQEIDERFVKMSATADNILSSNDQLLPKVVC